VGNLFGSLEAAAGQVGSSLSSDLTGVSKAVSGAGKAVIKTPVTVVSGLSQTIGHAGAALQQAAPAIRSDILNTLPYLSGAGVIYEELKTASSAAGGVFSKIKEAAEIVGVAAIALGGTYVAYRVTRDKKEEKSSKLATVAKLAVLA